MILLPAGQTLQVCLDCILLFVCFQAKVWRETCILVPSVTAGGASFLTKGERVETGEADVGCRLKGQGKEEQERGPK